MSDFFLFLSFLIIPIFILLFVRRLKRKKVYYSFTFLERFKSQSFKQILLKLFQLFYDIIFDFCIAIIIALILSNIFISFSFNNKTAFIIDASYSMMKVNINGITQFEKAVNYYYAHKNDYPSFDIYAGIFDYKAGKSKLINLKKMKNIISPKLFSSEFLKNFQIFEFDVNEIFNKKFSKYKKIIFITDLFPYNLSKRLKNNYEVVELGVIDKDFFYPVAIISDPTSDKKYCYFIKSQGNFVPKVELFDNNKLFIDAHDKVKIELISENSLIIETKEKTLLKVTLFNQSYYINLAKIPYSFKSKGNYSDLIKNVLSNNNVDSQILKFKERGFNINKNMIPSIFIYQEDKIDKSIKKSLKKELTKGKLINVNFNDQDYDVIVDPELTGGFLIATNKSNIINSIDKLRRLYDLSNKDLRLIFPAFISKDFIYKPQIIIYFLILSEIIQQNYQDKRLDYIFNLSDYKLNKAELLEMNNTCILYKKKDKLIYKNISIDEIYPYKKDVEIVNFKKNNNLILYFILLVLLFTSKIILFLLLKSK